MKTLLISMSFAVTSCSLFNPKELAKLPVTKNPNSLDSMQAQAVYDRSQYFPNETQLSICIIKGDSEKMWALSDATIRWYMLITVCRAADARGREAVRA